MEPLIRSFFLRLMIPPLAGFLCYGAWAYYVNSDAGTALALQAALTQGGYSFTITLLLSTLVERLFVMLTNCRGQCIWSVAISCLFLYVTSWAVNTLSGTLNVFLTLLPGAAVSTIYTVFYVMILNKLQNTQ